jgi:uncharacterized protein
MKVIIDTNFLLIPAQFGVDIFTEIERVCDFEHEQCILDKTLEELDKIIKEQKGKDKRAAKLAKDMIERKKLKIITTTTEGNADKALLEIAENTKITVATQDKLLRAALSKKGAYLLGLRQKTHLYIDKNYNL